MFKASVHPSTMQLRVNPAHTEVLTTPASSLCEANSTSSRKNLSKPYKRRSQAKRRKATRRRASSIKYDSQGDGTKPTIQAVREALLKPTSVNVPIKVSSDYLAEICDLPLYERLATTIKSCRAHPYPPLGFHGTFPQDVTKAGRDLCVGHEEKLVQLERVIRLSKRVLVRGESAPAGFAQAEIDNMEKDLGTSLDEYKAILLDIILGHANTSSSPSPSAQHSSLGLGQDKRFSIKPTEPIVVNSALHITPTERAVSRTICDRDFDGYLTNEPSPVLIWYTNKGTFPAYTPYTLWKTTGSLHMELAGEYLLRRRKYDYHQGVTFDGYIARLQAISVKDKRDILSEHKTRFLSAEYSLPDHRPEFVLDMVNLLRTRQDPRKMYNHTVYTRYYDANTHKFETITGDSDLLISS